MVWARLGFAVSSRIGECFASSWTKPPPLCLSRIAGDFVRVGGVCRKGFGVYLELGFGGVGGSFCEKKGE